MNSENIKKVRDHIAALPPERFDMGDYITGPDEAEQMVDRVHPSKILEHCGTAACIAGWTCAMFSPDDTVYVGDDNAAMYLGLDGGRADQLFRPSGWTFKSFAPSQAVAVLDHLIATGEVDWDVAEQVSA